jgi:hypothetical protein
MAGQPHNIPNIQLIRSGDELVQELEDVEIGFADDIIAELARKNHTNEIGPVGSPAFFDAIFMKGWNTSKEVFQPVGLAPRTSAVGVAVTAS